MNLHGLVSGAVSRVNPPVIASYRQSSNTYTTAADGKRTPVYAAATPVTAQRQPLTYKDLLQVDGLNLSGEKCAMYLSGRWAGVSRADQKGGDLLTMPDGSIWLVVQLLEDWFLTSGWVKVACVRQTGA